MLGGNNNETFAYGLLISAVVLTLLLPLAINILYPSHDLANDYDDVIEDLNSDYADFTGSAPVKEDIWALEGIFTPYQDGGPRGYTSDGWLYGSEIHDYTPSQYSAGGLSYTVTNRVAHTDSDNNTTYTDLDIYQYSAVGDLNSGIEIGDIYSAVSLDVNQKSNIFFSPAGKTTYGDYFVYNYSGYRYAFSPVSDYLGVDDNGDRIELNRVSSSCSLIWYEYYNVASGIAGQLVYTGSDGGTAYITAETIINSFNSANNTAKHVLQFNGVALNLYVRLDPYYSASMSIEDCFNNGYWSVMITSESADTTAYTSTDYAFNPQAVFSTTIDLLTFDLDDYGFSPFIGAICSLVVVVPLYVGLLVIGLNNYPVLILEGILLAIQAVTTAGNWLTGLI